MGRLNRVHCRHRCGQRQYLCALVRAKLRKSELLLPAFVAVKTDDATNGQKDHSSSDSQADDQTNVISIVNFFRRQGKFLFDEFL